MLGVAGKDATADFNKVEHSGNARKIREKYYKGDLGGYQPPKGAVSNQIWGMLALTVLLVIYSVYFFSTRK
ncbi:MAG: hypothetical protein JST59_02960 [Actinobacteria bacterium]|nr:hypothetical protein [Actinomycetota bacterium]